MNSIIEKQLPVAIEDWNNYRLPQLLEMSGIGLVEQIRLKSFIQVLLQHVRAVHPDTDDDDVLPCRVSFDKDSHITSVYFSELELYYPSSKTHAQ